MPKPSWHLQPWAQPCPETALSPAAGARPRAGPWGCLGHGASQPLAVCGPYPPWGRRWAANSAGAQGCLKQGQQPCQGLLQPYLSWAGRSHDQRFCQAWVPAPAAAVPCPQALRRVAPACSCLPEPSSARARGKGGGGNRTGSVAVAMPVSVIYIVYKSIKQSVLLSGILHRDLVLLEKRRGGGAAEVGGEGQPPPPQQTAQYQSGSILIIIAVCKHWLLSINALVGRSSKRYVVTSLDYTGAYERVRDRALHRAPPETVYCSLSQSRNLNANLALWSLTRAARCHRAAATTPRGSHPPT